MSFSDNIWWTRKARIQTEKRLLKNAFHANLLLLWYSFCSAASAIYYLNFNSNATTSALAGVVWTIFSVLVLCVAGFINGLTFKERAGLAKVCYESLNKLYKRSKAETSDSNLHYQSAEYEQILSVCENHTDHDYYLALFIEHVTNSSKPDPVTRLKQGLDRRPTWYHWVYLTKSYLLYFLLLLFLYLLPIILFLALEKII